MCALFVCQAGVIVICLSSGIPVSAMYHLHCVYLSQVCQCLLCIPFTVCTSARCACVCCVSPALCVSQPGVPVSAVYHPHCVYLRQVYLCLLCITCTVHISARCVCVCCVSPEMCVSQPGVSVSTMCHLHCVYLSQVYLCLLCITCTVSQPGVSASALRPGPKLCGCFFTSRTEPLWPACDNYTVSHSNFPSQNPVFICHSVHCWGNRDQRDLPSSYQRPVCCTHAQLTMSWAVGDSGLSIMWVAWANQNVANNVQGKCTANYKLGCGGFSAVNHLSGFIQSECHKWYLG